MSSSEEKIDVSYFRGNKEVASSMNEKGVILIVGKNCVEFLSQRSEWNLRKGESYCYIFEEVKDVRREFLKVSQRTWKGNYSESSNCNTYFNDV